MNNNRTSPHILSTSANLLGFCLFVITAIHVGNKAATSYMDEVSSVIALLLGLSCLLSFYSIRTQHDRLSSRLEAIAEYLFLAALIGIIILVAFIFPFVF